MYQPHVPFILPILFVLLVIMAVYFLIPTKKAVSDQILPISTIAPTPSQAPSPSPSDSFSPLPTLTVKPTQTPMLKITNTPQPSLPPLVNDSTLNEFKYPNAHLLLSSNNELELESQDDPTMITNWYKNKIQSLNLSANSFVNSSANEKILNKLSASNGNLSVNVEISRESANAKVKIKVKLTSK